MLKQPDTKTEIKELRTELKQFISNGIMSSPRDLLLLLFFFLFLFLFLFWFSLSGQNYSSTVSVRIQNMYKGCWKVLSPTRKETSYSDRRFWVSHVLFIIVIGGILVLFTYIYIYIIRLASNEIFSPWNKTHREAGRAKDLSAPLYIQNVGHDPKEERKK